ncbi:HET-E1 [Symbiodinium sp. KB8]|nr:HET-E1 [Symbiodinium sp. KB8]
MTKAERLWNRDAKEKAVDLLVNVKDWVCWSSSLANGLFCKGWLDLSRLPCHLNGAFNALSALRKIVQWAHQEVFEPNENAEPIAFCRVQKNTSRGNAPMDCWSIRRQYQNEAGRGQLLRLLSQFNDHISTHEWDGVGSNDWRWALCERSMASMGIVRMPVTDAMCHPSLRILLRLNEIIEWGMWATTNGGLMHDCSPWDEIWAGEENVPANAWKAPTQALGSSDRTAATVQAIAQIANALEPGAEIVLQKNAEHSQVIALSWR